MLRPGGLELTLRMPDALDIGQEDDLVEFAPGLGVTARETLDRGPRSNTGIERNEEAATGIEWTAARVKLSIVATAAASAG